jgi:hypothetical protein
LAAHTKTSAGPVDPPVYSTTVAPGSKQSIPFGTLDHRQRHPIFHRPGGIAILELHPDLCAAQRNAAPQANHWSVADLDQRSSLERPGLRGGSFSRHIGHIRRDPSELTVLARGFSAAAPCTPGARRGTVAAPRFALWLCAVFGGVAAVLVALVH